MNSAKLALLTASFILVACGSDAGQSATAARPREPILGLPCENCEAVFEGLPETLSAHSRIAPEGEPGEPLRIEGTVFDGQRRPAAGVIVYAYHTNSSGVYPRDERLKHFPAGSRHGRLRGWAQSDEQGQYAFDTIRPAGYPSTDIPQHIHMHVIEVGRCSYWIDDIMFKDDPRLTPEKQKQFTNDRGGPGMAMPTRSTNGQWVVKRDIILGKSINDYPGDKD